MGGKEHRERSKVQNSSYLSGKVIFLKIGGKRKKARKFTTMQINPIYAQHVVLYRTPVSCIDQGLTCDRVDRIIYIKTPNKQTKEKSTSRH